MSRLLRVGASYAIARELSSTIRGSGAKAFAAAAAASVPLATTAATSDPSTASAPASKNTQRVDVSCCGFPKDLIGAPSTVLDNGKFGEDACFIARYKSIHVAGVADGVGGWRKYGIDPSEFSSSLMQHCKEIVRSGDFEPERPDLIIANAYHKLSISPRPVGSSTACVIVVHKRTLYAANLGDSGYLVYRDGKIIHRSIDQTHQFNTPFQLSILPPNLGLENMFIRDTPEKSDLHQLDLESGDVILVATDGLWDNVPEALIAEALEGVDSSNLQAKCNTIALIARRLSNDVHSLSPFALKAQENGLRATGGKPDDVTIVCVLIS